MRTFLIALVCLGIGFAAGALTYRHYMLATYFREAPAETGNRPAVAGPEISPNGDASATATSDEQFEPDAIRLANRDDGVIVWEGEWANRMTGTFEILPGEDTGRDAALWVREGTGRNNGGRFVVPHHPYVDLGVADWFVDIPSTARYKLYMRIWALDQCGNSCWVGFDTENDLHYFPGGREGTYGANHYHWPEAMYRRWLWIEDEGTVYTLAAGLHRLHVEVREDGFAIDQIALVPENAAEPVGVLQATTVPGSGGLPDDMPLSESGMSARATPVTTPVDAFLAVQHHLLAPDDAPFAEGFLSLRLNTQHEVPVTVRLESDSATFSPRNAFSCSLTQDRPVAQLPFRAKFSGNAPRRPYDLRAVVTSERYPELTITRTVRVERPLDWWALGPLTSREDRAVGIALKKASRLDVTRSPLPDKPMLAWTRARVPEHFDAFGALDLNEMFGKQENCTAYIATRIHVGKSGAYRVAAAGDDTLRLRLNGALLVDDNRHAPLTDSIRSYPVTLPDGDHLLVGRVTQNGRWWQAFVQFHGTDDKPTADVTGLPAQ